MNKYIVEQYTICDGWTNTWHEYDDDNNEVPMVFDSLKEAKLELGNYLQDYRDAFECGDIESDENPDDFRIIKLKQGYTCPKFEPAKEEV